MEAYLIGNVIGYSIGFSILYLIGFMRSINALFLFSIPLGLVIFVYGEGVNNVSQFFIQILPTLIIFITSHLLYKKKYSQWFFKDKNYSSYYFQETFLSSLYYANYLIGVAAFFLLIIISSLFTLIFDSFSNFLSLLVQIIPLSILFLIYFSLHRYVTGHWIIDVKKFKEFKAYLITFFY